MQSVIELLNHYGYIILFTSLLLELIALPLPGELMMTYCGFLVFQAKLNYIISILFATAGASLGITVSYFIGSTLGYEFFKKYGSYLHFGPKRLKKTSVWFNKYGSSLLIVAYFIPGVRHVTGYFSGITKISYRRFALNAYLGAFIWACTFISLGKVLGENWDTFHDLIIKYALIGSLIIALILIIIYFIKNHRSKIIKFTFAILTRIMNTFHSFGEIKVVLACMAVAFLGLFVLLISLIHNYLSHDFDQFDIVTSYLVKRSFTEDWQYFMNLLGKITSTQILIPLIVVTLILIIVKDIDKYLEIFFLIIIIGGGEVLQTMLRFTYRRLGPYGASLLETTQYTFPSGKTFMAVVAYGFLCFMILRHRKRAWIKTIPVFATLLICFLAGLNPLFFQTQYPSDILTGYVFGGVWLTLNILLLEIYRILSKVY